MSDTRYRLAEGFYTAPTQPTTSKNINEIEKEKLQLEVQLLQIEVEKKKLWQEVDKLEVELRKREIRNKLNRNF